MIDFKQLLNTKEYSDLVASKEFTDSILIVPAGSHAYGTNISTPEHESDIDIRGIYLNPVYELLTNTSKVKPYECERPLDVSLYPLSQAIPLLTNCNPNVVELLGVDSEHIIKSTPIGQMLLDNKDLFLSRRAYFTFGNMAIHNLHLMQKILLQENMTPNVRVQQVVDSLTRVLHGRAAYFGDITNHLNVYKQEKAETTSDILVDINGLKGYPLVEAIALMKELDNTIRTYNKQSLNHRNNKKSNVKMAKHIMHTLRVLIMGAEILEGKSITTYRAKDRDYLLEIRSEKYTNEEMFDQVDVLTKRLDYAFNNSPLPELAPVDKITDLHYAMNRQYMKELKEF